MTTILLIGGADTGRAPMAAALLRRLLERVGYAWVVESAGVLGHDGEPAEIEARDTMAHMGLDIHSHVARTIADDLVAQAALLIALDRGTAVVLRSRFPDAEDRIHTLGELAGQPRDIPDPFRMQIGAWMSYARELESLLDAAVARMLALLSERPGPSRGPAAEVRPGARGAAVERVVRLLRFAEEMAGVVDWRAARSQLDSDLGSIAAEPYGPADLVSAYVGLLRAAIAMTPAPPSTGQLAILRDAAGRLGERIGQDDLNAFSERLANWTTR
jgi:protein-tyrosine-phosphatase